jgi:hypothetical protein
MKYLKTLFLSGILLVSFTEIKAQQVITLSKGIDHVKLSLSAVKGALDANDGVTAENNARELIKALNEVPVKYMTPKQVKVWTASIEKLQFDSRHIGEVQDVAHQKEHFASLSTNLQAVIDGLKLK